MCKFIRWLITLPMRMWVELHRLVWCAWWSLMVDILWQAWRIAKVPEQWLAARHAQARRKRARFVRTPCGFDPKTGRLAHT